MLSFRAQRGPLPLRAIFSAENLLFSSLRPLRSLFALC